MILPLVSISTYPTQFYCLILVRHATLVLELSLLGLLQSIYSISSHLLLCFSVSVISRFEYYSLDHNIIIRYQNITKTAISRQQLVLTIANIPGTVKRISESAYKVKLQNGYYDVSLTDLGWVCSCPDHKYRGVKCKHIFEVEISFALHKEVEVALIEPVDTDFCVYCKSVWIVKDGLRHNKYGDIQKFNSKDCGRYFTVNLGFERIYATPEMVTSAMQLYFTGESLRNIQKFLKMQGVKTTHVSIYNWIRRYVGLMKAYLEKITPDVADAWRADELYLKVKGNPKYLFALMDDQTRFWIA
jgi:putative transposase